MVARQIVEFSRPRGSDRRVFSSSCVGTSSFLVLMGQIVGFVRACGSDRRVFSCSSVRSSSFLVLASQIVEFFRPRGVCNGWRREISKYSGLQIACFSLSFYLGFDNFWPPSDQGPFGKPPGRENSTIWQWEARSLSFLEEVVSDQARSLSFLDEVVLDHVRSLSFLDEVVSVVEFFRPRGSDRRVFSSSCVRSSSFLVLTGQIVEFSRGCGSDRRVFSCS